MAETTQMKLPAAGYAYIFPEQGDASGTYASGPEWLENKEASW
jgi:hypothetical protein